ncbi:hypothetical protein DFH06DRAFT_757814 [Mycena polygramma]|nr:hypothetical protein DFH06DRAFT_757814 [Mycena polygramma]
MDDSQSDEGGYPYSSSSSPSTGSFDMYPSGSDAYFGSSNDFDIGQSFDPGQSSTFSEEWQLPNAGPLPFGRVNELRPSSLSGSSLPSMPRERQLTPPSNSARRLYQMEQAIGGLKKQNLILSTENRSLKNMYSILVDRIPALLAEGGNTRSVGRSPKAAAPLLRADFPHVLWWDQKDWNTHNTKDSGISSGAPPGPRGNARASAGINVVMLYVQYKSGEVIDGFRATEIRAFATALFNEFARTGMDPPTWQAGGRDVQEHFYAEIATKFPEMGYCSSDWKARHMATNMYSSWHSTRIRKRKDKEGLPEANRRKRAKKEEPEDPTLRDGLYTMPNDVLAEELPAPPSSIPSTSSAVTAPTLLLRIVNPLFSPSPPAQPLPETHEAPTRLVGAAPVPASTAEDALLLQIASATPSLSTQAPAPVLPATPAAPVASKKEAKKETVMKPTASKTPRNLCAIEWCKSNPGGYTSAYKTYWDGIKDTDDAQKWTAMSQAANTAHAEAAAPG